MVKHLTIVTIRIIIGMAAHAFNLSTSEAQAVGSLEFRASLGYPVRPHLKNKNKTNPNKQ